jgi:hypothetical protein
MAFLEDVRENLGDLREETNSKDAHETPSESSPLLGPNSERYASTTTTLTGTEDEDGAGDSSPASPKSNTAATISLLLIGVFVANMDSSLVLATNSAISSSFSQLRSAS